MCPTAVMLQETRERATTGALPLRAHYTNSPLLQDPSMWKGAMQQHAAAPWQQLQQNAQQCMTGSPLPWPQSQLQEAPAEQPWTQAEGRGGAMPWLPEGGGHIQSANNGSVQPKQRVPSSQAASAQPLPAIPGAQANRAPSAAGKATGPKVGPCKSQRPLRTTLAMMSTLWPDGSADEGPKLTKNFDTDASCTASSNRPCPASSPDPSSIHCAMQSWRGRVTRLIPPHYGIVDGVAFYVSPAVVGNRQLAVRGTQRDMPVSIAPHLVMHHAQGLSSKLIDTFIVPAESSNVCASGLQCKLPPLARQGIEERYICAHPLRLTPTLALTLHFMLNGRTAPFATLIAGGR